MHEFLFENFFHSPPSLFFILVCFFSWIGDCAKFEREEIPPSVEGRMENVALVEFFCQVSGNLTGSDFDHLNLAQS